MEKFAMVFMSVFIYRWQHWYHFKMFSTGTILLEICLLLLFSLGTEEIKAKYKQITFCEECFEQKKMKQNTNK